MCQSEITPQPESSSEPIAAETAIEVLEALATGLSWMSESDYPFEVALLPEFEPPIASTLLQLMGHDGDCPVEEMTVQNFFAPAIEEQDWYEEAEKETMHRFQTLLQWLEEHLSEVQVYRVGEIEIDVYIVGKTESGDWINLSTKSIET
jgi:Nuclease A inhibitor-like protein